MKKIIYYIFTILLLCIVWVVLMEKVSLQNIVSGLIIGSVSLILTNKLLHLDYLSSISGINPINFFKYVFYLIYQIYSSGLSTIRIVISGKVNVGIVQLETTLTDDLQIAVLANSITLTPGTVTIDKEGNKLKVLWLDCTTHNPKKAGKIIKKDFEKILSGKGDFL